MEADVLGRLQRASAPWLAALRGRLAEAAQAGRLPHAVLLLGQEGAGQAELAWWLAAQLLCESATGGPCGACTDCRLFMAGTHPDFHPVALEEEATAIRVEQIRDLADALGTRSYRGGRKIALINPSDEMNINSFNALLKTLEEPPDQTVLLLAAVRSDRLPATIRSRCSTQRVPVPATAEALEWLQGRQPQEDWPRLLELANGAPFLALSHAGAGLAALDAEMTGVITAAWRAPLDVLALAEKWRSNRPELRLAWLELWLTDGLRRAAESSDLVNNKRGSRLPAAVDPTMMAAGHRLLDAIREARRRAVGPLNTQLLLESLLVGLAEWMRRSPWRECSNRSKS